MDIVDLFASLLQVFAVVVRDGQLVRRPSGSGGP